MKSILILNGPPNSGKDTLADYLVENHGYQKLSFKEELFNLLFKFYNIADQESFFEKLYTREAKETKVPLLHTGRGMLSPREALIHISEDVIKPVFGKGIFGEFLAKKILPNTKYVVSDGGFLEEIIPVVLEVTPLGFNLCRLHREGCTFKNDSRNFLYLKQSGLIGLNEFDVHNDSTIDSCIKNILEKVY